VSCAPYIRLACGRILPYASHYRTGLELLVVLGGIAVAGRLWRGADLSFRTRNLLPFASLQKCHLEKILVYRERSSADVRL